MGVHGGRELRQAEGVSEPHAVATAPVAVEEESMASRAATPSASSESSDSYSLSSEDLSPVASCRMQFRYRMPHDSNGYERSSPRRCMRRSGLEGEDARLPGKGVGRRFQSFLGAGAGPDEFGALPQKLGSVKAQRANFFHMFSHIGEADVVGGSPQHQR
jgi:hypothetical protein